MTSDDKLNQLLSDFHPAVGPADDFMARLQSRLDIADDAHRAAMREVEKVENQTRAEARAGRHAVFAASLCGFVVGVLATLLFRPLWLAIMQSWQLSGFMEAAAQAGMWLAVGTVASVCAVNAYTLARTLALRKG